MIKYVIFDFDGTLADTLVFVKDFINEQDNSTKITLEKMRDNGVKNLLKEYKIPFWRIPKLISGYKRSMNEKINKEAKTFKGIPELLAKLGKNYKIGLISTNSKENIEHFLQKHKIKEYFTFIYTDSSLFGKDIVLKRMLKKYQIKPDEVIYLGDEDRDIEATKKVGIKIISVSWGYNSKRLLLKHNPDYIVDSPKEILKII